MEAEIKQEETLDVVEEGDESCLGDSDDDFRDAMELDNITTEQSDHAAGEQGSALVTKSRKTKDPIAKCDVCDKKFTTMAGARFHARHHHVEGKLYCLKCKKMFKFQNDLDRHMKIHTGERPYNCAECNKAFICKSSLRQHMKLQHIVGNVYECGICNRKFCTEGDLERHFRIHTGVKPFGCDKCTKRFTCKSSLNVHKRTHEGKKFLCSFCRVGFYIESDLRRHETTHTGNKPWQCKMCNKMYSCKSTLKVHEKNSHTNISEISAETGDEPDESNTKKRPRKGRKKTVFRVEAILQEQRDNDLVTPCDPRFSENDSSGEKSKDETEDLDVKSGELECGKDQNDDALNSVIDDIKIKSNNVDFDGRNVFIVQKNVDQVVTSDDDMEDAELIKSIDRTIRTAMAEAGVDQDDSLDEEEPEENSTSDIEKVYKDIDGLNKLEEVSGEAVLLNVNDALVDGSQIVKRAEISDEYLIVYDV